MMLTDDKGELPTAKKPAPELRDKINYSCFFIINVQRFENHRVKIRENQ